eukprot:Rmarinus@m.19878
MDVRRIRSMTSEEKNEVNLLLLQGITRLKYWGAISSDKTLVYLLRLLLKSRRNPFERIASMSEEERHQVRQLVVEGATKTKAWVHIQPDATLVAHLRELLQKHQKLSSMKVHELLTVTHADGGGGSVTHAPGPGSDVLRSVDRELGDGASVGSVAAVVRPDSLVASKSLEKDEADTAAEGPPLEPVSSANRERTRSRTSTLDEQAYLARHGATCQRCRRSEDGEVELALWEACAAGSLDCVRFLVEERGADYERSDEDGWTPVHIAARSGHLGVVKYLIQKGADFEDAGNNPSAAVNDGGASLENEVERAEPLAGRVLVRGSSVEGRYEMRGGEYDDPNDNGWRPVRMPSEGGKTDPAEYLAERAPDFDRSNKHGRTPVHVAAREGHLDLVKFLVEENGADHDKEDMNGWTPVHAACRGGHLDVVQYLVEEKGADWTKPGKDGRTPVHAAARGGGVDVLRWFVGRKMLRMLCFRRDEKGFIAVHHAAMKGEVTAVRWFVQQFGEEILWFPDRDGNTSLHHAARWWFDSGLVKYILHELRLTALCHVANNKGDTPFDVASKKCREVLRHAGDHSRALSDLPMHGWTFLCASKRLQSGKMRYSSDEAIQGKLIAKELCAISCILAETMDIGPDTSADEMETARNKVVYALENIRAQDTVLAVDSFLRENYGHAPLVCSPELLLNLDIFALAQTPFLHMDLPYSEQIWKLNTMLTNAAESLEVRMYLFNPENDPKERKLVPFRDAGSEVKGLLHGWGVGKTP